MALEAFQPPAASPTAEQPPSESLPPLVEDDRLTGDVDAILSQVTAEIEAIRLPVATYRLQFNSSFRFQQARELVDYFAKLGISHLYASPILQAKEGSIHGYDVVDPSAINREIGSREELDALAQSIHARQMGMILDVVPNHMSTMPTDNRWWQDVLENGPSSPYANYFDIDWKPLKPDLANKVLLPVLEDQYGKVLEDGQLTIGCDQGAFYVAHYSTRYPIAPPSYAFILAPRAEELEQQLGGEHPDVLEYLSILTAVKNLPPLTEGDAQRIAEQRREKEVIKRRLHDLVSRSSVVAEFLAENLRLLNGRSGDPRSFDRLDELLSQQAYRLAYWRVAADEINYRRFFDINDLAAICVENPIVFEDTHRLIFELVEQGTVSGLRIDHPDGLFDPPGYLWQLQEWRFLQMCRRAWQERVTRSVAAASDGAADERWPLLEERLRSLFRSAGRIPGSTLARALYIVVEKILGHGELVSEDWPVHGTVGYEFLNHLSGLFAAASGERPLTTHYARWIGHETNYRELAYLCKRLIVRMSMASELSVLSFRIDRISENNRWTRDFTLDSLTLAVQEVVAAFGVYRTYVTDGQVNEKDRQYVESAVARARRRNPTMSASIFDFVRDLLLLRYRDNADEAEREAQRAVVGKFQQLTGPIMAKAVEDTAFYRYNRLISLNEVGGEPERFGNDVAAFHSLNLSRLPRLARGLSSTATHDTKRGEDVRARINVLSEIPRQWKQHSARWSRWNRRFRAEVDGQSAPGPDDEYVLYQTLLGIWPDQLPVGPQREQLVKRLQQYMLKVAREAKLNTSWISPNEAYEQVLTRFVADIFQQDKRRSFLSDVDELARMVAEHGRWNSLAQLVLKIASPGVPDFYQGTELWSLTLVDPDNRQPIDFALRLQLLDELVQRLPDPEASEGPDSALIGELLEHRQDGRIKLYVMLQGLALRQRLPELFTEGEYLPLTAQGVHAEHVVALARRRGEQTAIAVVPRLTAVLCGLGGPPPLGELWKDTAIELPAELRQQPLRNVFTGELWPAGDEPLLLSRLLATFPVALLADGFDPRRSRA